MNRASLVFAALLAVLVPASLLAGRVWIDPFDVAASGPNAALILAELRLPRAVLAIVVGAGLGAAGAAMQGYLRNPLADPGLFGIAPMAALGAVARLLARAACPACVGSVEPAVARACRGGDRHGVPRADRRSHRWRCTRRGRAAGLRCLPWPG